MLVHIKVSLIVIFFFSAHCESREQNGEMVERAKKSIDNAYTSKGIEQRALALDKVVRSSEYQNKMSVYENRIKEKLGLPKAIVDDSNEVKSNITGKLVLFISSSIPESTLRLYALSLEKVGGIMVLRGTVDDPYKLTPTIRFMDRILKADANCETGCKYLKVNVTVDPRLFRLHNITQVPALIFSENLNISNYIEKKTGDGLPSRSSSVVFGDSSLRGLITELQRLTKNDALKHYLDYL